MKTFRLIPLLSVMLLTAALIVGAESKTVLAEEGLNDTQRKEIEMLIQVYLRENPEVLVDSIRALRIKQEMKEHAQAAGAVEEFKIRLAEGLNAPSVGNADASVTIVEFFDYRCGYCKKVLSDLHSVMANDNDIRMVFMEFPILGEDSMTASRIALAVWLNWPDRYVDVHNALMGSRGNLNAGKALELAASTGIDTAALKQAINSPEIDRMIEMNYELAQSMNINGTPAFIIGDQLVPGAIGLEDMKQLINEARRG